MPTKRSMRDLMVQVHSSLEEVGESQRDRVRSGYKRTLDSYHETHKSVRPETHWVAIPVVGRNSESIQGYLHEILVPHNYAYKQAVTRPFI